MPNRLKGQTSPYLLQHADNPVDWYPWGEEALVRARDEDKPIFLSIGYAACHWCHVMERESFVEPEVAAFLNEHFVSIKVDREERPDLDDIYMLAVQLMTGSGGWPMTVFLTPELKPFFGGTYFPPESRHGLPSFLTLLRKIRDTWTGRRDDVEKAGGEMADHLRQLARRGDGAGGDRPAGRAEFARAVAEITGRFDARHGGFSPAPKFPPHGALGLLWREHDKNGDEIPREMAVATLDAMALGGIYDQVGGGFARYAVDERWLVPHFEKMLYDQALLVPCYLDGWLVTGKPLYRRVVQQTLDFVRREMTDAEGGFWSSLDADSEGVEGKFYVWTPDEVTAALGESDGAWLCRRYDITDGGNFEGKSIPNLLAGEPDESEVERAAPLLRKLLEARAERVRPGTDDKVLTAWNGLMIGAFARAHLALGRDEDLEAAIGAATFLTRHLLVDGRLKVSYRAGRAALNGYLDDYAFSLRGLIDLYEASGASEWLDHATQIAEALVRHFHDDEGGGFFFTSDDHETLLTRAKSYHDGALPAGSGVAAEGLLRLALHRHRDDLREVAEGTLTAFRGLLDHGASSFAALLVAAELAAADPLELKLTGGEEGRRALLRAAGGCYLPNRILSTEAGDGQASAQVCFARTCEAPIADPEALRERLRR